jgi:hypothetical protein
MFKVFQPGKQETGNKEASKKVKRGYRSANVQADAIEENCDQTEHVIFTGKESSLTTCKARCG